MKRAYIALLIGLTFSSLPANEGLDFSPQQNETSANQGEPRLMNEEIELISSDDSLEESLRQAISLTAQGKRAEAAKLYKSISEKWPAQGYQAEGRFLHLAGSDEQREDFRNRLNQAAPNNPLAAARGFAALKEKGRAMEILGGMEELPLAAILFESRLLKQTGREDEAERQLYEELLSTEEPAERKAIFEELFRREKNSLTMQPERLVRAIQALAEVTPAREMKSNELLFRIALDFMQMENYFNRRDEFFDLAESVGGGAVWFAARLLAREQRFEDSFLLMNVYTEENPQSPQWELLIREQIDALRNMGQAADARALLTMLSERQEKSSRVKFELAELALAAGDEQRGYELLTEIEPKELHEAEQLTYYSNLLKLVAKRNDLDTLLELYPQIMKDQRTQNYSLMNRAIFQGMRATADHKALEAEIRARFAEDAKTDPILWLLAARAAEQARRTPNILEAMYQWTLADPDNIYALQLLAKETAPLAEQLLQADPSMLTVPQEQIQATRDLAELALKRLIREQPFAADFYTLLIRLYRAEGREEEIRDWFQALADESQNPNQIAQVAYVFATSGFEEDSLPLYDRAVALAPDRLRFQANRAAAWTRTGRTEEAIAFYRRLLEEGVNGKPYHMHDQIQRLWTLAKSEGMEAEMLEYFRGAMDRIDPAWRKDALGTIGLLLAEDERREEAVEFFNLITGDEQASGDLKAKAWQAMAMLERDLGNLERAKEILSEAATVMAADSGSAADFEFMRAELLNEEGRTEEAMEIFLSHATEARGDEYLLAGYFRAAQIAESQGQRERAAELYRLFLASESTDFTRRRLAEERLAELGL